MHFFLLFWAAYVGLATIAGYIWWFVYSDSGPRVPYYDLVRLQFLVFDLFPGLSGACSFF